MKFEINVEDIDSSRISNLTYQSLTDKGISVKNDGELKVTFCNGSVYLYKNVTIANVIDLVLADSVGSAFQKIILSKNLPYKKIL